MTTDPEPEVPIQSKPEPIPYKQFTNRACKAMQLAQLEANRNNSHKVTTAELLAGLAGEGSSIARATLNQLGINLEGIRKATQDLVPSNPDCLVIGKRPFTEETQKAIDHAVQKAKIMNDKHIGTEHLLLGLLDVEPATMADQILASFDANDENIRKTVFSLIREDRKPETTSKAANTRTYSIQSIIDRSSAAQAVPIVLHLPTGSKGTIRIHGSDVILEWQPE